MLLEQVADLLEGPPGLRTHDIVGGHVAPFGYKADQQARGSRNLDGVQAVRGEADLEQLVHARPCSHDNVEGSQPKGRCGIERLDGEQESGRSLLGGDHKGGGAALPLPAEQARDTGVEWLCLLFFLCAIAPRAQIGLFLLPWASVPLSGPAPSSW